MNYGLMVSNKYLYSIAENLWVVFLYVIAAYLGLQLAVPPGYATLIWPCSGVALGAAIIWGLRILPGVFIGSLIINLYTSMSNGSPFISSSLIGFCIGFGAVLQTIFGWYLIKKYVGFSNPLYLPKDILMFAILSGPVSCLVNATWSNTALFMLNILPSQNYALSWITWWIGDSIGVLIFTPSFLILFYKPREVWRNRITPILLPLALTFTVVIIAYDIARTAETKLVEYLFSQEVLREIDQIQNKMVMTNKKSVTKLSLEELINKNNYSLFTVSNINNGKSIEVYGYSSNVTNKNNIQFESEFNIIGNKWLVEAVASSNFLYGRYSWHIWEVLIGGFLFCVLVNSILFIIYGQKRLIQIEVDQKTSELQSEISKKLLLLNSAGEGIFGLDMNGNATFVNPAAEKMLGYSEDELIGKSMHDLVHLGLSGKSHSYYECPMCITLQTGEIQKITNDSFWNKDKLSFWADYTSTPIKHDDKIVGSVVIFNDVSQRKMSETALERMAYYDALTNLPNRFHFLNSLVNSVSKARANNSILAVCFMDLDNFKDVNDSFGHYVGDELLQVIPSLLKPQLRKSDLLARVGGDEFAFIIENITSNSQVSVIIENFMSALNKQIEINRIPINITVSIGIAVFPLAGETPDELLKNADIAMYRAKAAGRNNYVFFSKNIERQVKRHHQIDRFMRNAIEKNEFYLTYQMQYDSISNQIAGFEVLLRWHNETIGDISPGEFIPIAESNGCINEIGEWVIKRSFFEFNKLIPLVKNITSQLGINVSIKQLENDRLLHLIKNLYDEFPALKNHLIFEITETALMQNPKHTMHSVSQLRNYGIKFALDDFGIGYSSMLYLKQLNVSFIKIDKNFVKNILIDENDSAIVKATIQLANSLGIQVIAEGIETKSQLEYLKEMGCYIMQGHYIAKPMSYAQLETFLSTSNNLSY